ncbi:MAG: hypothetical protein HFG66_11515 [Hungatella sp.]|nr:hypothetical protein [Hungatella sp.]
MGKGLLGSTIQLQRQKPLHMNGQQMEQKNTIINQGNVPSGPEQTFEDSKHRVRGGGPVMPVEAAPAKKRGGSDLPAAQRNRTRQRLLKITPYWE